MTKGQNDDNLIEPGYLTVVQPKLHRRRTLRFCSTENGRSKQIRIKLLRTKLDKANEGKNVTCGPQRAGQSIEEKMVESWQRKKDKRKETKVRWNGMRASCDSRALVEQKQRKVSSCRESNERGLAYETSFKMKGEGMWSWTGSKVARKRSVGKDETQARKEVRGKLNGVKRE